MKFTEQDIKVLHYLYHNKLATYKQIKRDFYPTYQLKSVCNRIYNMEKLKLVTGNKNNLISNGDKILSVSKMAFNQYIKKGDERRVELQSDAKNHDVNLLDVQYHLMQSPKFAEYFSENQLQTWGPPHEDISLDPLVKLNPDAVVKVNFEKGSVWAIVEYEHTLKTKRRYDSLIKKFYHCSSLPLVFYVCRTEKIIDTISNQEMKLFKLDSPKIFYQVMHKIAENDVMTFYNYHKHYLQFNKDNTQGFTDDSAMTRDLDKPS